MADPLSVIHARTSTPDFLVGVDQGGTALIPLPNNGNDGLGLLTAAEATQVRSLVSGAGIFTPPVAGTSDGNVNATALQAFINANSTVKILTPGIYYIGTQITIPSYRYIEIGAGVELRAPLTYTNPYQGGIYFKFGGMFTNANWSTGNTQITIVGEGIVSMEHVLPYTDRTNLNTCGIFFENCTNLKIGYGLTVKSCFVGVELAGCYDWEINDVTYLTSNTTGSPFGNDAAIWAGGQCGRGVISNIYGETSDDFVVLSTRDIEGQLSPMSVGNVFSIRIFNIHGQCKYTTVGGVVSIYAELWDAGAVAGTPPTITGLTSVNGGNYGSIVTATTDRPHKMLVGSHFTISGATPSTFNTTGLNRNASNNIGTVLSVPSATSFTYVAKFNTGTYVSGATLTVFFDCRDIEIENITGDSIGQIVKMAAFITAGAMDNTKISGIYGRANTAGIAAINNTKVTNFNLEIEDAGNGNIPVSTIFRSVSGGYLAGKTILRRFNTKHAVQSGSSGEAIIEIPGFDDVLVTECNWQFLDGGSRVACINTADAGYPGIITVRDCTISGGRGAGHILRIGGLTKKVVMEDCHAYGEQNFLLNFSPSTGVGDLMTVSMTNCSDENTQSQMIQLYMPASRVLTLMLNNIMRSNAAQALIYMANGAGVTVNVQLGNYTTDKADPNLIDTGSTFGAGSVITVTGVQARIDVSTIARLAGAIVYNTNAALGTLGAAGPVVCQGTAANSWRLMGDPTKQY